VYELVDLPELLVDAVPEDVAQRIADDQGRSDYRCPDQQPADDDDEVLLPPDEVPHRHLPLGDVPQGQDAHYGENDDYEQHDRQSSVHGLNRDVTVGIPFR
jgi:hypothetical protein